MNSRNHGSHTEALHALVETSEAVRALAAEATTDPQDSGSQALAYEAARQVLTDDQISAAIWRRSPSTRSTESPS